MIVYEKSIHTLLKKILEQLLHRNDSKKQQCLQLLHQDKTLKIGVTAAKYFKHAINNNTNDNIFGFLFKKEDNQNVNNLMIGDKDVHFLADDNFRIGNRTYHGTPGLYKLITFKDPLQYTEEDLTNYVSIVKQTHVLYQGNNPANEHRWNKSNKWKYILKPIWEEIQQEKELKPIK